MSKYVIIQKSYNKNPYSNKPDKDFYTLWTHTVTKYKDDEPYFSASLNMRHCIAYSIKKENIAKMLKMFYNNKK
jgi:hypothetical protein